MSSEPAQQGAPRRFFVPDLDELWSRVGEQPVPERTVVEHLYLDTAHPSLFYTGFARARRVVPADSEPLADGVPWRVEHRPSGDDEVVVHLEMAESIADVVAILVESTDYGDLRAYFGVRFNRDSYEVGHARFDIDREVTYYSLLGRTPMVVGQEAVPRMTARTNTGKKKHDRRLDKLVEELPRGPHTTKKWMGFHYMKSCYELPRFDDLAGYEYELKLEGSSLDVDPGELPFPILEVHQSDSLRRYYRKYRACLRGEHAHLVEKGPVQAIGGVLKRREVKKRGLDPWDLPEPTMVMRRYKREVNVLNPDSGRVYTLSLHHCDAGETFEQLEIEYDGRLVPGAVTAMARFRLDGDPRHFLQMATRADAQGWGHLGDSLRQKYLDLAGDAADRDDIAHAMTGAPAPGDDPVVDDRVEQEVVEDMQLLRRTLLETASWRPSRRSKRKWLRGVYADDST